MQILGLLGMYFDAVAVEVEKYVLTFFSDWPWAYCDKVWNSGFSIIENDAGFLGAFYYYYYLLFENDGGFLGATYY
jgi:hypothetical protein